MNAFEINKIIGAILGTLLLVMGVGFLAEAIYAPIENRGPGYALPGAVEAEDHGEVEVVEVVPLGILLASASAENGARVARKCQACHTFDEGGGNKTGPGLFDIVSAGIGAVAGFSYSGVLNDYAVEGRTWTYEALYDFLAKPKEYAPGTKMSFSGLNKEQDRLDMLAYLQSLSNNPVAYPSVDEAAMAGEEEIAPAVEETTHGEETAPAVEEEATPAVEEVAPETTEEMAPEAEETTPIVEEAAPATSETSPSAPETTPNAIEVSSLGKLLANADVSKGARVARKCTACHGFKEGDGNKVGPPLYDIVGQAMAGIEGFRYSDTLISMGADGGVWTYENLNEFMIKPREFIAGTKMSFAGLRKEEDRVNLLAYLQSLSENPVAFPQ